MTTRDDELLAVLSASLGPVPSAEPTWAEISALHRVLDTAAGSSRRRARPPSWRVRRPLSAAVAGLVVLGGASAAAAVSGAVMPQPVRVAARAAGLPVESPELASARAALARLRGALGAHPRDVGAVRARADEVRDRLAHLSADDRSHVEAEAAFLLEEADHAVVPPPVPLGSPSASASPGDPPAAAPAPAATPSGDDHGQAEPSDDRRGASGPGPGSGENPSGDDHTASAPSSGVSGPGPSGSSGDGEHTAAAPRTDNSGPGSGGSDGGSVSGSSHDGGSDGGGHSGPG